MSSTLLQLPRSLNRLLGLSALAVLGSACSGAPPAPPVKEAVVHTPPVAETPPEEEPAAIETAVVAAPPKLAVDGDVAEWEDLALPEPPEKAAADSPSVAIAFRPTDVVVAARLSGPTKDGVWLTIAEEPPELPKIGFAMRGGGIHDPECEHEIEYGPEGMISFGKAQPPEVVAACKALIVKHAEVVARHQARFYKQLRLDQGGAQAVSGGGALSAIAGAQFAFKAGAGGGTLEVKLPLSAMPRVAQAPFTEVRIVATIGSEPPPPAPATDDLPKKELPEPVEFEPYGRLRTEVLRASPGTFYPSGLSYQPGEGLSIETFGYRGYDRDSVVSTVESLYEKKASLGDLEVGIGMVSRAPILVALVKGQFVSAVPSDHDIAPPDAGPLLKLKALVPRGEELHAFFFVDRDVTLQAGIQRPIWYAFAISKGGEWRPALDGAADDIPSWNDAWDFSSSDMTTFGLRGVTNFPDGVGEWTDKGAGVEILYTWDAKSKMYVAKKKKIPPPKPPKDHQGT